MQDGEIIIINDSVFDWTDVILTINPPASRGYTYEVGRIRRGETIRIPSSQFILSAGTRFNPYTTVDVRIQISAREGTKSVSFR